MEIKFECAACGQHLSAEPDQIGTQGRCPACDAQFAVPAPADGNAHPEPDLRVETASATQPVLLLALIGFAAFAIAAGCFLPVYSAEIASQPYPKHFQLREISSLWHYALLFGAVLALTLAATQRVAYVLIPGALALMAAAYVTMDVYIPERVPRAFAGSVGASVQDVRVYTGSGTDCLLLGGVLLLAAASIYLWTHRKRWEVIAVILAALLSAGACVQFTLSRRAVYAQAQKTEAEARVARAEQERKEAELRAAQAALEAQAAREKQEAEARAKEFEEKLLKQESASGLPRQWFLEHRLDYEDPDLGVRDEDKDGYTNREEFVAKTSPTDPQSHPDPCSKLRLVSVQQEDIELVFAGAREVKDRASGARTMTEIQINTKSNRPMVSGSSRFYEVGEPIRIYNRDISTGHSLTGPDGREGDPTPFTIARAYFAPSNASSGEDEDAVIVLKSERGETLELHRGRAATSPNPSIVLRDTRDGEEFSLRIGEAFSLIDPSSPHTIKKYLLKSADPESVVVEDPSTNQTWTVLKGEPQGQLTPPAGH